MQQHVLMFCLWVALFTVSKLMVTVGSGQGQGRGPALFKNWKVMSQWIGLLFGAPQYFKGSAKLQISLWLPIHGW